MVTITPAAAEIIRRFIGLRIHASTICLAEASDVSTAVAQAVKRGASQIEIREIAAKAPPERRYLYPLVFPSSHFLWLTTTINGFRFAARIFHPSNARQALRNGLLDAAERGLVLRDRDGRVVSPRDETRAS